MNSEVILVGSIGFLITLLFLTGSLILSKILKNSLSFNFLFLLLVVVVLYAVSLTNFISVFSISLLLLLYYYFILRLPKTYTITIAIQQDFRKILKYSITFILCWLLLNWEYLFIPHYRVIFHHDTVFYAEIADFINLYKVENHLRTANIYEKYRYPTFYHFPEIYLAAFLSSVFNLSSLMVIQLIVNPILLFGIFLSIEEIFIKVTQEQKVKSWILTFICLLMIGGFHLSHNKGYIWWYDYKAYYHQASIVNYHFNKFYFPFWIFLHFINLFNNKRFFESILILTFFSISNFTIFVFGFSLMILTALIHIHLYIGQKQEKIKFILTYSTLMTSIIIWILYLNSLSVNIFLDNPNKNLLSIDIKYMLGVVTSVILNNLVYVAASIIILLLHIKNKILSKDFIELITIISLALLGSLLFTTILYPLNFFDSFQPFFNSWLIVKWLIPITILVIVIKFMDKKFVQVIYLIYAIMLIISMQHIFQEKMDYQIFNENRSKEFLTTIEEYLKKNNTDNQIFVGVWSNNYRLSNLIWGAGLYLKTYSNKIHRVDIFIPAFYLKELHKVTTNTYKRIFETKPLFNYYLEKGCNLENPNCLVEFLKKTNIHFLLIEKDADIPSILKEKISILAIDSISGDFFAEIKL